MEKYLELAKRMAKEAGRVQIASLNDEHVIEYKGKIDIVTDVDKHCEKLIVDGIRSEFPDHDILAEEGTAKRADSDFRWVIDPLDATVNYSHGFPFFGVSISLEFKGEISVGVIHDPNRNETFYAAKGLGAFLNEKKINVSKNHPVEKALLATGFAYNVHEEDRFDNIENFRRFIKRARAVRRPGAASIDLAYIACGRLDGFWELFLKPWDMAAGVLLIREAGGRVTSFDGSEYDLYGTQILASNSLIHDEMIGILMG